MPRTLLVALAMTAMLSAASPSRVPIASADLVREAAIVCGGNGCNVVQTKQVKRRAFKPLEYTKPLPKSS